jgi:L-2-hydroxyglutarate oxidase LhgO
VTRPDFLVVGGGIVGLGTAMALAESGCGRVLFVEAEAGLAMHETVRS